MGENLPSISQQDLIALLDSGGCPPLVDVRKPPAFLAAAGMVPTAVWHPHEAARQWGTAFPAGSSVIVYCVHGHEVSQGAAAELRSLGLDARYLDGGYEGYVDAGGSIAVKPEDGGPER